ncbi:MAG: radical SAM protein, partial [Paludibacteraceae bacterium]|nr:radical SAM protein [Paludibacteraceae bacterium]
MSKILFITPPLTQLNCAYPATAQLTGYLRSKGLQAEQMDLSIELIDRLLTTSVMRTIFQQAEEAMTGGTKVSKTVRIAISNAGFYCRWVEPVKHFLQGKDLTLQNRFSQREFWPNQKRLPSDEDIDWDYGGAGTFNRAQLFCTLMLEDISMVIQSTVSQHFEMVRYGEKLCMSLSHFEPLLEVLNAAPNLIDELMLDILDERLQKTSNLTHIGLSVPFPGNLYAALRCAQWLKQRHPHLHINMGGGYVNTELRQLSDTRLFAYIDSLSFDDGELPMLRLLTGGQLLRTMRLGSDGQIERIHMQSTENEQFSQIGTPCLEGLPLHKYMDTADSANPMQRLWANGRWNKLMMAHGCYWAKCTFCDTCLDYIGRYDAAPASVIVDRMEGMLKQSGESGFHFIDEAAPPVIIKGVAEEILRRGLTFSYWSNIRFEKVYTHELCYLMAQSGCIAVSGGIEVASERVLKLINKGVSVASVRETLRHFRDNGIMVHAYLMFGFPTQTENELFESLDTVRQLFEEGLIQSAFWHRYAMTCHSPSGREPERFGARWAEPCEDGHQPAFAPFANNEIAFTCKGAPDWSLYSRGLNLATQNYMRGTGFDVPVK